MEIMLLKKRIEWKGVRVPFSYNNTRNSYKIKYHLLNSYILEEKLMLFKNIYHKKSLLTQTFDYLLKSTF